MNSILFLRQHLQLRINPGLNGLREGDGAVVDKKREVVLGRIREISIQGQANLARGVLHLDSVGQNQGSLGFESGGVSVGGQLACRLVGRQENVKTTNVVAMACAWDGATMGSA